MGPAAKIAILILMLTLLLCVIVYFARGQVLNFAKVLRSHKKEAASDATTTV